MPVEADGAPTRPAPTDPLEAAELDALGLSREPFDDRAIDGLFYPGGGRQECLEQLQHLLRFSDCVVLVTGLEGSGRSTLRDHLARNAESDVSLCSLDAHLMSDPDSLTDEILDGFGLPRGGGPEALSDFCAADRLCWLLIDDAHQLSEQEIRFLAELLQRAPGLHLALFASPPLKEILQRRLPDQQALQTLALQPLDAEESRAYLRYRLAIAGLDGPTPFSATQWQQLSQASRGNFSRLHDNARRVLREALSEGRGPGAAPLPRSHIAVVSMMAVAVAGLYLFNHDDAPPPADTGPRIAVERQPSRVLPSTVPDDAPVQTPEAETPPTAVEAVRNNPPEPEPEPESDAASTAAADEPDAEDRPAVAAAAPDPAQPASDTPEATGDGSERFVYDSSGRRGGDPDPDERHLLARQPGDWTVQLMGSHDAQAIRSFREQYSLSMRRYRKLRNGKDWYVLVYGSYPSRDAAVAGVAALPEPLQRLQPWIRSMADVQAEIRSARALDD